MTETHSNTQDTYQRNTVARLFIALTTSLLLGPPATAQADLLSEAIAVIIDEMGLYLPEHAEACNGIDIHFRGACIPASTLQEYNERQVYIGVVALTEPERFASVLQQEALRIRERPEAYEVQVTDYSEGNLLLQDGAVLESRTSRSVGYIGYREDGILYNSSGGWVLCMGGREYRVRVLDAGRSSHYSRRRINLTLPEIETREECR